MAAKIWTQTFANPGPVALSSLTLLDDQEDEEAESRESIQFRSTRLLNSLQEKFP